jgi:hypothetical protein
MKKKLTLYVDEGIIEIAKMESLNISQVVEDFLRNFLEIQTTEVIDQKINKLNQQIGALSERKNQLLTLGLSQEKSQGLASKILEELKDIYRKRVENIGFSTLNEDLQWLHTPKNINRCKMIGKTPEEIVIELRKEK